MKKQKAKSKKQKQNCKKIWKKKSSREETLSYFSLLWKVKVWFYATKIVTNDQKYLIDHSI